MGEQIVQEAPQTYFDIDVEADGKPGYGSLLSVGAVSPWGDTFYAELKPTSERFIQSNRDFCEEHGLQRERLLDEGQEPKKALRDLAGWALDISKNKNKQGQVLTAFNASFDYPWIDLAMLEAGISKNPFGIAGYCIKSLAMVLQARTWDFDYNWKQTAKNKLPKEVLPAGDFTHNALEDAIYQQDLHFALVGLINHLKR